MAPWRPSLPVAAGGTAAWTWSPSVWGGLAASSASWPGPAGLARAAAAAALSFAIGGFLAGVRAAARRPTHAVAAWAAAYLIHASFIVARLLDASGGRTPRRCCRRRPRLADRRRLVPRLLPRRRPGGQRLAAARRLPGRGLSGGLPWPG